MAKSNSRDLRETLLNRQRGLKYKVSCGGGNDCNVQILYKELSHFTHRLQNWKKLILVVCFKAPRFSLCASKTHKAVSFSFAYIQFVRTRLEKRLASNKMLWFTQCIVLVHNTGVYFGLIIRLRNVCYSKIDLGLSNNSITCTAICVSLGNIRKFYIIATFLKIFEQLSKTNVSNDGTYIGKKHQKMV